MKKDHFKQLLMTIFLISSNTISSMDSKKPDKSTISIDFIDFQKAGTSMIRPTDSNHEATYGHYINAEIPHTHYNFRKSIRYWLDQQHIQYNIQAALAMMHNRSNPLLALHKDTLKLIMPEPCIDTTMPLKDTIKTSLLLKATCKRFNDIFTPEAIGKACQIYSKKEKNKLMKELIKSMNDINYWSYKRQGALILVHAGADNNAYKCFPLLYKATLYKDQTMIEILFKNNANPNQKTNLGPTFFSIKTVDIAELFIAHGLNVNTKECSIYPNILWKNVSCNDSHKLVALYLKHKVDTKAIDSENGLCILHKLFIDIPLFQYDNFIEISKLLLDAVPDMINTLNKNNKTPLDLALTKLKSLPQNIYPEEYTLLEKLITLFKEHGAKTAEELKQEQQSLNCFICFDASENLMQIPCTNPHTDKICINCYEKSLEYSAKCPLCRGVL